MRLAPTRSTARAIDAIALAVALAVALPSEASVSDLKSLEPKIRATWEFTNPALSEQRFRGLVAQEPGASPAHAVLVTQVARALGLQQRFDEANAELDSVEVTVAALPAGPTTLHVRARLFIERGRVFNSSGDWGRARPLFEDAVALADSAGLEALAIDAAHMVAIAAGNDSAKADALAWNERALARAEASKDPEARNWRASLLNNLAWTHHDAGEYAVALGLFQRALDARLEMKDAEGTHMARWAVARCLRSLGRVDEALARQRELLAQDEKEKSPDGYVYEEIAECLAAEKKEAEAKPWFKKAYDELSQDPWLTRQQPERIARLLTLAGGDSTATPTAPTSGR
jgi:tetratricopeptide (TPR) repeat protein